MTNREKKAVLRSYRMIDRQIKSYDDQINELTALIRAPEIDGMPRGSSAADPVAGYVEKREHLFRLIDEAIDEKAAALRRIRKEINKLSQQEETLLTLRYIDGFTFERVAEEMCYSWRHTLRLHGQALAHFMEGGEEDHEDGVPRDDDNGYTG